MKKGFYCLDFGVGDAFLYYRKLRELDLAVLHCLDTRKAWIGKQPPAGAQIA